MNRHLFINGSDFLKVYNFLRQTSAFSCFDVSTHGSTFTHKILVSNHDNSHRPQENVHFSLISSYLVFGISNFHRKQTCMIYIKAAPKHKLLMINALILNAITTVPHIQISCVNTIFPSVNGKS